MPDLNIEETAARLQEMSGVLLSLESNHGGAQDTLEELFAMRQAAENLRRWESDMQEESDLGVGSERVPNHSRNQKEMVVVDPHRISLLVILDDNVRDRAVQGFEVLP